MFFREERDKDFLAACESVRRVNRNLSASEIAVIAVYLPTQSFYLTTRELAKIVSRIRKGYKCTGYAAELYVEIEKRVIAIENGHLLSCNAIARIIDGQPAPRFYISEQRAILLYYECLNKYSRRMLRLAEIRRKRKRKNELRRNNNVHSRNGGRI